MCVGRCEGATKRVMWGPSMLAWACACACDGADGPHHLRVCCVMEECFVDARVCGCEKKGRVACSCACDGAHVCVCVLLLGLRAPSGGAGCPTPVCDGVCVCV